MCFRDYFWEKCHSYSTLSNYSEPFSKKQGLTRGISISDYLALKIEDPLDLSAPLEKSSVWDFQKAKDPQDLENCEWLQHTLFDFSIDIALSIRAYFQ